MTVLLVLLLCVFAYVSFAWKHFVLSCNFYGAFFSMENRNRERERAKYLNVAESISSSFAYGNTACQVQRAIINFDYIDDALEKFRNRFRIENIRQKYFSISSQCREVPKSTNRACSRAFNAEFISWVSSKNRNKFQGFFCPHCSICEFNRINTYSISAQKTRKKWNSPTYLCA